MARNGVFFFAPREILAIFPSVDSMFHLELGVDFDRGFSSGFSPPDYFRHFSVFGQAHRVPKSVPKSVFSLRDTQEKKSATKSVAKSVLLGRKIHRKIRHSHQENPPQFHSAETCALPSDTSAISAFTCRRVSAFTCRRVSTA